jgi:glutamate-1-semialdehyde 2,1-aminomutase
MMKPFIRSESEHLEHAARKVIPGGVMSNWKKSKDFHPVFMVRGENARLWDVDGNEYIDYSLSMGPAILGHSNDHFRRALARQIESGIYCNESTDLQLMAAEKVCAHVGCAELVRFSNSGSEANLNAVRVARAYTGKNMIVRFNGHYHGSFDSQVGGIVDSPDLPVPLDGCREDDPLSIMAQTEGRAAHAFADSFMVPWNDLDVLSSLFERHGKTIAAVIMEPVMVNFSGCVPEPGYLEGVRSLCDDFNVILIFDEVLTGFRMALGGAQEFFGVEADLATFGKAIGGGFPVSAFAGRREIMDVLTDTRVMGGGTYNGHPLAMTAVIATLEELEKENGAAYQHINRLGKRLKSGLDEINQRVGQNLLLQGFPGAWTFTFSSRNKIINHEDSLLEPGGLEKAARFGALLKEYGVLTLMRFCTSIAHEDRDVDECLNRAEDALKSL